MISHQQIYDSGTDRGMLAVASGDSLWSGVVDHDPPDAANNCSRLAISGPSSTCIPIQVFVISHCMGNNGDSPTPGRLRE